MTVISVITEYTEVNARSEVHSVKTSFRSWLRPSGTIRRGRYAVIGLLGFAVKHNLDRALATLVFHRDWSLFNYWIPLRETVRITALQPDQARFLGTMLALSLPFIWIGVTLTMQRLRSAGLSPYLVCFFFIPFLNLLFFLVLCIVPERPDESQQDLARFPPSGPGRANWLPASALGSAAAAILIVVPTGLGIALLGAQILKNYGWGLFVALPYCMGFTATLIYGARRPRTLLESTGVACLSVLVLGGLLLGLAFEGAICLLMAAPLAVPLAIFGGFCAHRMQRRRSLQADAAAFLGVLLIVSPGTEWVEHVVARPAPVFVVRSSIDVQANPEEVWRKVVAFSEIEPPTEWLFRAGIAYPVRAKISGTGVGAERRCIFSTGAFVEPIQVWDEPRLLKFSVTSNPAPMEEWTPYSHIEPPHLHGFLVSEGGQFQLTPLPGGGTRLEGTTWYRHGLFPAAYWRLWSDAIIHRIHMRVLTHIRDEAERK